MPTSSARAFRIILKDAGAPKNVDALAFLARSDPMRLLTSQNTLATPSGSRSVNQDAAVP